MNKFFAIAAFAVSLLPLHAQMTPDQRVFDLQVLASLYAKQYAPYEWKQNLFGYDMLDLAPWAKRARAAKDDLEYFQILAQYVGSLNDAHDTYFMQSDFAAYLPFNVDIYDGKILIDGIDRGSLPLRKYAFVVGDELVSIDGKPVDDLIAEFMKIDSFANPRSTRRWAVDKLTYRTQASLPRTIELPDNAEIVVRRKSGDMETYNMVWVKSGNAVKQIGPTLSPRLSRHLRQTKAQSILEQSVSAEPSYRKALLGLQHWKGRPKMARFSDTPEIAVDRTGPETENAIADYFGMLNPSFKMPAGFTQRLGRSRSDYFYSGTFLAQGKRIGYIRISDFEPLPYSLLSIPTRQFSTEMAFLNANTDGLIVDVMNNPGGFGCYANDLFSYITTQRFNLIGLELRPTLEWVISLHQAYAAAVDSGATAVELKFLAGILHDVETAYYENRGRTGRIDVCGLTLDQEPARNTQGVLTGYSKPAILLTNEFSTSAGDVFAALFQDNRRGPLVGIRTAGAGGSVNIGVPVGFYSEGSTNVTIGLLSRPISVAVSGYPVTAYIENVGVHPDVVADIMTKDNLDSSGAPFVKAFTDAIVAEINSKVPK